jgi:4-hydroxy-3-methylbut-2-enyl diphosphate reductase
VIDATCPLVTKVHGQAQRFYRDGYDVIVIGHAGHQEVEGTLGSIGGPAHLISTADDVRHLQVRDPARVAYVTQTTLSVDDTREVIAALKARFPAIRGQELDDICYATQNRQNAVRALATEVDLLLVVGSVNSSNSNRLRELGAQTGLPAYLINDARDIDPAWLHGVTRVGITAGASAPEVLVQGVLARLAELGVSSHREYDGIRETTSFRLPKPLIQTEGASAGNDQPSAKSSSGT